MLTLRRTRLLLTLIFFSAIAVAASAVRPGRGGVAPTPTLQRPPAYNPDHAAVLDTLGVRLGMTLVEARQAAAKVGAEIGPSGTSITSTMFLEGPPPTYFQRYVKPGPNYTGPSLGLRGENMMLLVFPKDTQRDFTADDNLVVYYIAAAARFPTQDGIVFPYTPIQQTAFEEAVRRRFPDAFMRKPTRAQGTELQCADAGGDYTSVLSSAEVQRAGGSRPPYYGRFASAAAASACRPMLVVVINSQPNGLAHAVQVARTDVQLGFQAAKQLSAVVGYQRETKIKVEQDAKAAQYAQP
jgi:hypothetical protein